MDEIDKNEYLKEIDKKDARIEQLQISLKEKDAELSRMKALLAVSEDNVSRAEGLLAQMAKDVQKYSEELYSVLIKTYGTKADALLKVRKGLNEDLSQDADGEVIKEGEPEPESKFFQKIGKNGRQIEKKTKGSRSERKAHKMKSLLDRDSLADVDLPTEHITLEDSDKLRKMIEKYGEDRVIRIGENRTVFIDYRPMNLVKVVVHHGKYVVKDKPEEGVAAADTLPRMLPKTKIGDRLLAAIIADKFVYRVSYATCAEMFRTCGYLFDRREFSRWQIRATEQLEPLYRLIQQHLQRQECLQMDETPVSIDTPSCEEKKKKYMWSMQITNVDKPAAWFTMGPGRNGEVAIAMLGDFKGYLQSDGYSAYSKTARVNGCITNVSCAAHMRRKFVDAYNVSEGNNLLAEKIVHEFDAIFDEEWDLRHDFKEGKISEDVFLEKRRELISPHIDMIEELLKEKPLNKNGTVLESPKYETAASYCLNYISELRNFLSRSELTPSNNLAERGFKDVNRVLDSCYKFGSDRGADSASLIFTLIRSATLNGLSPHAYLEYVMVNAAKIVSFAKDAPSWEDLLPWNVDRNDEIFRFTGTENKN